MKITWTIIVQFWFAKSLVHFFSSFFHHSCLSEDGKRKLFRLVQHFSTIREISTARKLTHIVLIAAQGWIVTAIIIVCRSEVELVVGVENFILLTSDAVDPEMVAFARRDVTSVVALTSNAPAAPHDGTFIAQITVAAVEPFRWITSWSQRHFTATIDLIRIAQSNGHNLELEVDRMTDRIGCEVMAFFWSAFWGTPHAFGATVL